MCRPDQSARTAQADLVDTLRRCFDEIGRHNTTFQQTSYENIIELKDETTQNKNVLRFLHFPNSELK